MKRFFSLFCVLIVLSLTGVASATKYTQNTTYTYSASNQKILPSPDAYTVSDIIKLSDYGNTEFSFPQDLFVNLDGDIYVSDTNNNRIVIIKKDGNIITIDSYGDGGKFNKPTGVYVDRQNKIYIADSENFQVVRLNADFSLDKLFQKPTSSLLSGIDVFKPSKVAVSSLGNIYIICDNVYEGIIEINEKGEFVGYAGMNKVSPSLWDLAWRSISTKAQKASMVSFLPVTFLNMDLNDNDFIYATCSMESNNTASAVKKLNPGGNNVLINTSGLPLIGDMLSSANAEFSKFKDICYLNDGIFTAIDSTKGKIFCYDGDGNILFVFGGTGSKLGQFTSLSAIDHSGLSFYVLDGSKNSITVFSPTEYGSSLLNAVAEYQRGEYKAANAIFSKLIRYNSNCEVAYTGLGKSYLRVKNYYLAMKAFNLSNNKTYYSKALKEYRNQLFSENFTLLFAIILLLLLYLIFKNPLKKLIAVKFSKEKPIKETKLNAYFDSLHYASYIVFHPFNGFHDMRHEKKGSMSAAFTLLIVYAVVMYFKKVATGFTFSSVSFGDVNILLELMISIMPFLLFCVANWCLATLMEGEGRFKDIVMMVCYSLLPAILIQIPVILASHILSLDEAAFMTAFETVAYLYTGFLLIAGMMTIHQYSLKRTIVTALLTICGIAVILFIGFLFVNLAYEVFDYIKGIYTEILFRQG